VDPIGVNENHRALKILTEEFIDGKKPHPNASATRTAEEMKIFDELMAKLKDIYKWNGETSFALMAMQNCSDLFVYVCKLLQLIIEISIKKQNEILKA
jgi:hypothetical protein